MEESSGDPVDLQKDKKVDPETLLEANTTKPKAVLLEAYQEEAGFFRKDNAGKNTRQQERREINSEME